jgi:hypothetical protein
MNKIVAEGLDRAGEALHPPNERRAAVFHIELIHGTPCSLGYGTLYLVNYLLYITNYLEMQ